MALETSTSSPMIINDFSEVLASHDQPREKSAISIILEFPASDLPPKSTLSTDFERLIQEIDKGICQFDRMDMHSVLSKEVTSDTKEAIQSMPFVKPSPLSDKARNKPTQSVPLSDITNLDSPIPSTQAQAGKKWARIQRLIIRSLTQDQESETPLLTLTPSLLQNAKLLNVPSLMNTYHQRWWLITSPAGRNELALLERAQTQELAHRSRA